MSQIRKIKRKQAKNKGTPDKGKSAFLWLVVMAVILIAVVAFLGFRNISTAPTPDSLSEVDTIPGSDELRELSLVTSSEEEVLLGEVMNESDQGTIFLFFLGAG